MNEQRKNPFCVISKEVYLVTDINDKEHKFHMIETNSSWGSNPYGEEYAVVPDDMVTEIMETHGFCDIVLNEDGTEVVSFTAREIPEIPVPEPEPTQEERIATLEAEKAAMAEQLAMQSATIDELLTEILPSLMGE